MTNGYENYNQLSFDLVEYFELEDYDERSIYLVKVTADIVSSCIATADEALYLYNPGSAHGGKDTISCIELMRENSNCVLAILSEVMKLHRERR